MEKISRPVSINPNAPSLVDAYGPMENKNLQIKKGLSRRTYWDRLTCKLKARVQGNVVNSPYELAPPTLADRGEAPSSFVLAVFRYFFDCEMSTKTDLSTRSRIEALLPLFRSNKKLLEELEKSRKMVSLSTVERIRAEKKKEAQGWRKPPKRLPDHQKPHPDRKRHVKKIATWINPSNPLTVSEMALRLRMSRGYVRKILTKILGVYQVKKRKVHDLTEKQKAVRYERGKKFMKKYLTRRKLKLLFTMDEMMIRTSDLRGQSNFYYNGNRVVVPENMRKIPRKN